MHLGDEVVDVRHQPLAALIERRAAPVHSAGVARNNQRSLQRRRGEGAFGAQLLHPLAATLAIEVDLAERIVCGDGLRYQRRRKLWERLGRRSLLARHIRLRDGFLYNRKEWLAGEPIEDEQLAALGSLHDRRNEFAILRN